MPTYRELKTMRMAGLGHGAADSLLPRAPRMLFSEQQCELRADGGDAAPRRVVLAVGPLTLIRACAASSGRGSSSRAAEGRPSPSRARRSSRREAQAMEWLAVFQA